MVTRLLKLFSALRSVVPQLSEPTSTAP